MSNYRLPTTDNDFSSSVGPAERSLIPGLTLFDVDCKAREKLPAFVIDKATGNKVENYVMVPMTKIEMLFENDFKCPICLDTMEKTATVTTCLHRFCGECIQKTLRQHVSKDKGHECPSCRAGLASRRASKPDTEFDTLIALLTENKKNGRGDASEDSNGSIDSPAKSSQRTYKYDAPASKKGVDEGEKMDLTPYWKAHQDKINEFKARQAITQKANALKRQSQAQAAQLANANKKPRPNPPSQVAPPTLLNRQQSAPQAPATPPVDPNKILFGLFPLIEWLADDKCVLEVQALKLTPNPDVNPLDLTLKSPYLRVPCLLKIGDLKQYAKKKYILTNEQFAILEILCRFDKNVVILDDHLTLKEVAQRFWADLTEFHLFFRLYKPHA